MKIDCFRLGPISYLLDKCPCQPSCQATGATVKAALRETQTHTHTHKQALTRPSSAWKPEGVWGKSQIQFKSVLFISIAPSTLSFYRAQALNPKIPWFKPEGLTVIQSCLPNTLFSPVLSVTCHISHISRQHRISTLL